MSTRRLNLLQAHRPAYVVWELTLRCDQPCTHCGSRAGSAREAELDTDQALAVVEQLAAMGTDEVVLIGGEAYLHPGFLTIISALREKKIRPTMTTGGRGITDSLAQQMARAGIASVSVSVDGLATTHDLLRAARGSFESAIAAIRSLRQAGIVTTANTNVNRLNRGDLESLYAVLRDLGIAAWQVQITTPLGRAADRPALILQPYDLMDVMPRLAALKQRAFSDGILIMPGNNLGYFGKEEALLRSPSPDGRDHFQGCLAGQFVMGIESSGAVKGCPSLQSDSYVGGSLTLRSLRDIWDTAPQLGFTRQRSVDTLWGFCRDCDFAEDCMGGCSFTAHALFGRPGNNPYCHYRAQTFAKQGLRERLVLTESAPGRPFDHARFALVVEPLDAEESPALRPQDLVKIRRPQRTTDAVASADRDPT